MKFKGTVEGHDVAIEACVGGVNSQLTTGG